MLYEFKVIPTKVKLIKKFEIKNLRWTKHILGMKIIQTFYILLVNCKFYNNYKKKHSVGTKEIASFASKDPISMVLSLKEEQNFLTFTDIFSVGGIAIS